MQYYNNPNFGALTSQEWIVTNGIGGYASSNIFGTNTRRYHGLLVAAFDPPGDRRVLVSKIEERLNGEAGEIQLSTNTYPGTIHPEGYRFLKAFNRSPLPMAVFQAGPYKLDKTVFMPYGSNTTFVEYTNTGDATFELELTPLFVYRSYHALFQADDYFDFYHEALAPNCRKIYAHYGATPFFFGYDRGDFHEKETWFRQFEYAKEAYRGLDNQEDAKGIGFVKVRLEPGERVHLWFSTDPEKKEVDPARAKADEIQRQKSLKQEGADFFFNDLIVSGDQFLVYRKSVESQSIIAGYHWFMDWGRDAMIAMRGLTISLGKEEASASIIRTFLRYLDQGMLPNRFPDDGEEPEYNTIDATLWLFVVLYEYHLKFNDLEFVQEVFPRLTEILEAHREGTRYGIHVTEEGLLYGGEGIAQLTWMDARVGDFVVTPRHGCPVEVNALWYNALKIYAQLGKEIGLDTAHLEVDIDKLAAVFRAWFINEQGYLSDVVQPGQGKDDSIRPNQIYAVSLPFSPLAPSEQENVLRVVSEKLYTPFGLRSLAPEDPDFKSNYGGDVWQRDTAYHQGTVWAFLWGEWALAYLNVHANSEVAKAHVRRQMEGLRFHFYEEDCLHGISEIFDGLDPKDGRGCIQQAWSIGMLIRVHEALQKES